MIKATVIDRGELTVREAEVLACVCEGLPNKAIARRLAISAKTVGAHLDKVYHKLAVRQASIDARCAAISTAISRGMVSVGVKALALVLIVSTATMDDEALARSGRLRALRGRVAVSRVRELG